MNIPTTRRCVAAVITTVSGRGRTLHARRDVRGLAEHLRPGVQADAHGEARPVAGGEASTGIL